MSKFYKRLYKLSSILIAVLIGILLMVCPVLALTNPGTINFGTGSSAMYNVFENVLETGDWLITAEGNVYYADPADYAPYDADELFLFEFLNAAGTVTLASTTLNDYGDRPISIYLSAAQKTALGLVSGTAYGIRITGNPLIFGAPAGNTVEVYLGAEKYIDQADATDDNNPLRDNLIKMATNIQTNDIAVGILTTEDYIETVQGIRYLTLTGGDIFQEGIPLLTSMCPILFQAGVEAMSSDAPESTGAYALTLTPAQQWGDTVANGLTNIGLAMGINQALAGSVVLLVIGIMLALYVYQKTESGVATMLLVATTPFLGAYLGLMPLALAFILVIIVVTLMGYFFFSRGAL